MIIKASCNQFCKRLINLDFGINEYHRART